MTITSEQITIIVDSAVTLKMLGKKYASERLYTVADELRQEMKKQSVIEADLNLSKLALQNAGDKLAQKQRGIRIYP